MPRLDGRGELQQALKRKKAEYVRGYARGSKKAGLRLQRESQKEVPIQFGVLRASAGTRSEGSGFNTTVYVGYSAEYAAYVHENLQAAHGSDFNTKHAAKIAAARPGHPTWFNRGPRQKAKFLEDPLRRLRKEIIRMVRAEMETD